MRLHKCNLRSFNKNCLMVVYQIEELRSDNLTLTTWFHLIWRLNFFHIFKVGNNVSLKIGQQMFFTFKFYRISGCEEEPIYFVRKGRGQVVNHHQRRTLVRQRSQDFPFSTSPRIFCFSKMFCKQNKVK